MAAYRTPTHYYEVDNYDLVSPRARELSGSYAPNHDREAFKRRFRVRLHPALEVTGERIQAAIEAQRGAREMSGD